MQVQVESVDFWRFSLIPNLMKKVSKCLSLFYIREKLTWNKLSKISRHV
jgi:hypothetical protein